MIERLEEVVARTDLTLSVSTSTISDALRELSGPRGRGARCRVSLATLRHRLSEMNRMRVGVDQYRDALARCSGDAAAIELVGVSYDDGADCPMCGNHTDSA